MDKWGTRGLANEIGNITNHKLIEEYGSLLANPPRRGEVGKKYFIKTHNGCVSGKGGSNRFEEHLAMALWNQGRKLIWPCNKGNIILLDYQFPLKAWLKDSKIGKVDLLGITKNGQLTIIELKVMGKNKYPSNSPLDALIQALRYAAIIEGNMDFIKKEAKKNWDIPELDDKPLIQLMAPKLWWDHWLKPESRRHKSMGDWQETFIELLAAIEDKLGLVTECFALKNLIDEDIDWKRTGENKPELPPSGNPFHSLVRIGEKEPYIVD